MTHNNNKGFTLIETLVVIVIIGILASISISKIRFDRFSDNLAKEKDRFIHFYQSVADNAILYNKTNKIEKLNHNLIVKSLQGDGLWSEPKKDNNKLNIEENIELDIIGEIILYPSGQSSIFEIKISDNTTYFNIKSDALGQLEEIKANEKTK